MPRYALLTRESSNRVFGSVATGLLAAEVEAVAPHLSIAVANVEPLGMGGLDFVCFDAEILSEDDIFIVSNLALSRGVFEYKDDGDLRPLAVTPLQWFESDLVTIQRYVGKTNEQFTHLLLNLALASSRSAHERAKSGDRVRLLDPVAGRGSTMNRGLVYGFDVAGIEVDDGHVDQYRVFLATYLKDHRVKHKVATERIRRGEFSGTSAFDVDIRPGLEIGRQHVRMVRSSTDKTAGLFTGKRFDVIAGDLPYGIRHSSRAKSTIERSPEHLVADSIRGWRSVLEPGGAIGLSWNATTMKRDTLAGIVTDAGLDVIDHPRSFEHRVDRQITRDVLVATRR